MQIRSRFFLLPLAACVMLAGCAGDGSFSENYRTAIGGVVGAVAGGVLGNQVTHKGGTEVGIILGGLAGGAIGNYMDRQQSQIKKLTAGSGIGVNRVDNSTLELNIPGEVLFETNQYVIKPGFYQTLNAVANVLNQYSQTVVHVYGYTDNVGTPVYNQGLSERRAQSAASYLEAQGVNTERMVIKGFGQNHPRASNDTAETRAQNRRVEIFIKAIDASQPQAAYQSIY